MKVRWALAQSSCSCTSDSAQNFRCNRLKCTSRFNHKRLEGDALPSAQGVGVEVPFFERHVRSRCRQGNLTGLGQAALRPLWCHNGKVNGWRTSKGWQVNVGRAPL